MLAASFLCQMDPKLDAYFVVVLNCIFQLDIPLKFWLVILLHATSRNFARITSWNCVCDRFFIVASVKLIAAFVNAFAIWPRKEKKKKKL